MVTFFEDNGYRFVRVNSSLQKSENLVNINFNITEGIEKYINKIIISGNTRTNDNVIRSELSFLEWDPFNQ